MKLEQQVASLELCKKLKELGVKQESLFYYCNCGEINQNRYTSSVCGCRTGGLSTSDMILATSAFTVAELGEMLPDEIDTPEEKDKYWGGGSYFYVQIKSGLGYGRYGTEVVPDSLWIEIKENDTEADARAKMLIYLLENKLLTPTLPKGD